MTRFRTLTVARALMLAAVACALCALGAAACSSAAKHAPESPAAPADPGGYGQRDSPIGDIETALAEFDAAEDEISRMFAAKDDRPMSREYSQPPAPKSAAAPPPAPVMQDAGRARASSAGATAPAKPSRNADEADSKKKNDRRESERAPAAAATEAPPAEEIDVCKNACRALASMQRAATHLCDLAGDTDARCQGARTRLANATERVRSSCPECRH